MAQRRNYIIGELVTKYFPGVTALEPQQNSSDNAAVFRPLEAFLLALSQDKELVRELMHRAGEAAPRPPDA